jgi:hypothetical protein
MDGRIDGKKRCVRFEALKLGGELGNQLGEAGRNPKASNRMT